MAQGFAHPFRKANYWRINLSYYQICIINSNKITVVSSKTSKNVVIDGCLIAPRPNILFPIYLWEKRHHSTAFAEMAGL